LAVLRIGAGTALLVGAALALAAEPEPRLARDEKLLERSGVATNGPALLEFFRSRTPSEETHRRIAKLIEQLDSNAFADRQEASRRLIEFGPPSLPALRQATVGSSLELTRRAERCIQDIEKTMVLGLPVVAARVLKARRPEGAWQVLFAYLPYAEDESAQEALAVLLGDLGASNGQVAAELKAATRDPQPARRIAAAAALARSAKAGERTLVRKLLDDPEPRVRLFTARTLVFAGDKSAVPTLLALVRDGPIDDARRAHYLLCQIAGECVPGFDIDAGGILGRGKCWDAWTAWWKANEARVDLSRLGTADDDLGADQTWLVERLALAARERLDSNLPMNRGLERARGLAVLIAAASQDGAAVPLSPARATLRDAALNLAATIKQGNREAARRQLQTLPYLHPDPRARAGPLPLLEKELSLEEVMYLFSLVPRGGLGVEKKIMTLVDKNRKTQTVPAAELNDELLFQAQVVAQIASWIKQEIKQPKKQAEWQARAEEARLAAVELATAVKAKDGKQTWRALRRVDEACSTCHDIFRK
jgi:hypothetical protein